MFLQLVGVHLLWIKLRTHRERERELTEREGGSICNLRSLKTTLLAKNALNFMGFKYGKIHPWNPRIPPKCSWYFRAM